MKPRNSRQVYILCAVGVAAGVLLLVLLDGAAISLAGVPLGLSIGMALRTWWKKLGWNPGITITEDAAGGEALRGQGHSLGENPSTPGGR